MPEQDRTDEVFDQLREAVASMRQREAGMRTLTAEVKGLAKELRGMRSTLDKMEGADVHGTLRKLEGHFEPEGTVDKLRMEGAKSTGRAQSKADRAQTWGIAATIIGVILGLLQLYEAFAPIVQAASGP